MSWPDSLRSKFAVAGQGLERGCSARDAFNGGAILSDQFVVARASESILRAAMGRGRGAARGFGVLRKTKPPLADQGRLVEKKARLEREERAVKRLARGAASEASRRAGWRSGVEESAAS